MALKKRTMYWHFAYTFNTSSIEAERKQPGGAELGGPRGPVPPHLFWIYVVKFLKFRKIYFFHFFVPPHKKFASAHPDPTFLPP